MRRFGRWSTSLVLLGLCASLAAGCESKVLDVPDADDVFSVDEPDISGDVEVTPDDDIDSPDSGCPTTAGCIEPGTRCVDGSLVTCAIDPFGCLFLSAETCEPDATCVETQSDGLITASCVSDDPCAGISDCETAGASCDGNVALVCAEDDDGCLVRSFENCAAEGAVCKEGACTTTPCEGVEVPCPTAGLTCTGTALQDCVADEFGCLSLMPIIDCATSGGFCSAGPPAGCNGESKAGWTFVRVMDLTSSGPGGAFSFTGVGRRPVIQDGRVVVVATTGTPADPVETTPATVVLHYELAADTLSVVASEGEPIPDGTGNFVHFDTLSNASVTRSAAGVVFTGNGPGTQRGFYVHDGTGLSRVVDRTTTVPSAGTTFVGLADPRLAGGRFGFNGNDFGAAGGAYGISIGDDLVSSIATKSVTMPDGAGTFTGVELADLTSDGSATLEGFGPAPNGASFVGPQRGIYKSVTGGALQLVANRNMLIPDSTDRFDSLGGPLFYDGVDGEVLFFGRGPAGDKLPLGPLQRKGIYLTGADGLVRVVDTTTPMPGGDELFSEEATDGLDGNRMSLDEHRVAFRGVGSTGSFVTRQGIYVAALDSMTITAVIDTDSTLDGRAIAALDMGRQAFDDGQITFFVRFDDGGEAIYVARTDTPGE